MITLFLLLSIFVIIPGGNLYSNTKVVIHANIQVRITISLLTLVLELESRGLYNKESAVIVLFVMELLLD